MASNSTPDLSLEHSNAQKLAAEELAKYCQDFDRWRTVERLSAGLERDLRTRGMLAPLPAERLAPAERQSADQ